MTKPTRLGVIVVVALGSILLGSGARADEGQSAATGTGNEAARVQETDAPADGASPGAAGMEPPEAIVEDPGAGAHRAWVESIWNSP
jgi:hypothetical protein